MSNLKSCPKISVVTPSYNQGHFLEQCITSILSQDYPNLEYFIIDGGSTDRSIEVIKQYQALITFWVSEPDEGQSDAINKGLQMATGNLVAWLNADDFYLPGALAATAEAYLNQPDASFYFGDGLRVDETGQPLSGYFPQGQVLFNQAALIFGLNYILQPATFINRTHLVEMNYRDPHLRWGLDTDLWLRLAQLAPPLPILVRLAASREYKATKTATGSFQRIEELRQIAEKYSGSPMTPGALCYFLDTLHRLAQDREDIFPKSFKGEIEMFWSAAANLMAQYGARPDGFPTISESQVSNQHPISPNRTNKSTLVQKIVRKLGLSW